jgi:hypothetical protein
MDSASYRIRDKGQELRKSALQGCEAYGLGSQWTVPRIGYEIKDRNSGRAFCKDVKLMDLDTQ